MAGVAETLRFVIDMNADGAIREAKKFGDTVEKETAKGERSIDKFSRNAGRFGAASVAFGGAVLYGLGQTVSAYAEAEKQHLKLTNAIANSDQTFTNNGKAIEDAAQSLQTYTTVEGDAAEAAAGMLVQFGLTEDQVTQLLPLVGDLSRKMGIDMEQAAKIAGKAAEGAGAGGLSRMGIVLDETAYKADAFGATMDGLASTVGGFAEEEAGTAAGKLEMLRNNLGDIVEGVGAGAADVLDAVVGPLAEIASQGGAAAGALEGVGRAGAILGAGAVLVGGLSLAASSVGKISTALHRADGSLNAFGKSAKFAGGAIAALAVVEGVFAAVNAGAGYTDKATDAINRMTVALKKGEEADAYAAFTEAAQAEQNILRVSSAWEGFGAHIEFSAGVETTIENAQRAIDSLDPANAQAALDGLEKHTATLPKNSELYKTNTEFIQTNRDALKNQADALDAVAEDTGGLTEAQTEAVEKQQEWTDALAKTNGALGLYELAAGQASAATKGFGDAAEALDTDEQVLSSLALGDALRTVGETVGNLPKDFDEATAAAGGYTEQQTAAVKAVTDWGDAAKAQIETLIASGATHEEVSNKAGIYRDALSKVMAQAGLTQEQIVAYQEVLGLTDPQVETEIKLSGDAEAKFKLTLYQGMLDDIDPEKRSEIIALIAEGEYQAAASRMEALAAPRTAEVFVKPRFDENSVMSRAKRFYDSMGGYPGTRAMAAAPAPAPVSSTVVNISLPAGIDGREVERTMRRFAARNGTVLR